MKTLLSKNRIAEIKKTGQIADADIKKLCQMAEKFRQYSRQKDKRAKQKPKKYLKSTDYLSSEQFAKILCYLVRKADIDRKRTQTLTRAILNEMLVILLAETGLRASEVVNLRLHNLPVYHGKPEIEVVAGKGNEDRTVGVSEYLVDKLKDYISSYHKGHRKETALFESERGGAITYAAIYKRIKTIGTKVGIWINGNRSKLTPHKFRHTFATLLLDVSDNEFLIQFQLGHEEPSTTAIYTRTLSEKLRGAMEHYHKRLWRNYNPVCFENS